MKAGDIVTLRRDAYDWKRGQPVQLVSPATVCYCRGSYMRDVKAWEVIWAGKKETLRQSTLEAT